MTRHFALNIFRWGILSACLHVALLSQAQFVDVSDVHGIDNINEGTFDGNGVSFYDFNHDGWDDLTLANGDDEPLFYINNQGSLELTSLNITVNPVAHVVMILWADYDNDGDSDLLTTQLGGYLQLWENDGEFNFTDISASAGLDLGTWDWWGASWCDYDHDGDLDFYAAKYYDDINNTNPDHESQFYRNNGDGTFTDVTIDAGVHLAPQATFQPVWFDYDHDGWEDLYLIIDRIVWINRMFKNNGDGTFTDMSGITGTNLLTNAMTGTMGDFDNDLDYDLYVTNGPAGNFLLENEGIGIFDDITTSAGVGVYETSWGSLWLDYDNDTWQDLFVGTVGFQFGPEQNFFFTNNQNQTFTLSTEEVGLLGDDSPSFVCAMGDLNNDGYYDFVTNNNDPYPSKLWLNDGGDNNYLSLSFEGVLANRDGIGTWINCYAEGNAYTRFTHCGEDLAGQSSVKEIFGLGQMNVVDSLTVTWNSGTVDKYFNVPVNQHYHIVEGQECITTECDCLGDFTDDLVVNTADLLAFLPGIGCMVDCDQDLTGDGQTNTADLLLFLSLFSTICI